MNSHYELLFYNCFCVSDAGVDTDDAAELSPDFFGPVAGQANETTGAGQGGSVRPGFATRRLHRRRRLARVGGRAEAAGEVSLAWAVRSGGYVNWASGTEINTASFGDVLVPRWTRRTAWRQPRHQASSSVYRRRCCGWRREFAFAAPAICRICSWAHATFTCAAPTIC